MKGMSLSARLTSSSARRESKLGMLSGLAVVLLVAVFFQAKPAVGTAYIGNDTPTSAPPDRTTPPPMPPARVTVPDQGGKTIWRPTEPREIKPVSRDPLLWP